MYRLSLKKIAFFGDCPHFKDSKKDITLSRAIQYLCLKEHEVDRKDALRFGQRTVCKIDSTRQLDGPPSARILRTKKIAQGTVNGWHNGAIDVQYDLGSNFRTDLTSQMLDNIDEKHYREFLKREQKQVEKDQIEMDRVFQFHRDLATSCKFRGLSSIELMNKLQRLKEENRRSQEQPTEYVELNGQKFFHVLDHMKDYIHKRNQKPTILQDMRAFQSYTSLNRKLEVKVLEPGEPLIPMTKSPPLRRQERLFTDIYSPSSEEFNNRRYIFKVQQIPTKAQHERHQNLQKLIQQLQENSLKTPMEPMSPKTTKSSKGSETLNLRGYPLDVERVNSKLLKTKSQFFLNVCQAPSEISQQHTTTDTQIHKLQSKSRSLRFSTIDNTNAHYSPSKRKQTSTYQPSSNASPPKRQLENRISNYVKQQLDSQNKSQNYLKVDTTALQRQQEGMHSQRERYFKKVLRMRTREPTENPTEILSF